MPVDSMTSFSCRAAQVLDAARKGPWAPNNGTPMYMRSSRGAEALLQPSFIWQPQGFVLLQRAVKQHPGLQGVDALDFNINVILRREVQSRGRPTKSQRETSSLSVPIGSAARKWCPGYPQKFISAMSCCQVARPCSTKIVTEATE